MRYTPQVLSFQPVPFSRMEYRLRFLPNRSYIRFCRESRPKQRFHQASNNLNMSLFCASFSGMWSYPSKMWISYFLYSATNLRNPSLLAHLEMFISSNNSGKRMYLTLLSCLQAIIQKAHLINDFPAPAAQLITTLFFSRIYLPSAMFAIN